MKVNSISEIPRRATIRAENVGKNVYLYAYWKENGKLRKVYIGKSVEELEYRLRYAKIAEQQKMPAKTARKLVHIAQAAKDGYPVAEKYANMYFNKKCSIDWAYRKTMEQVKKICVEMKEVGLDPSDLEQRRSYLTRVLGNRKQVAMDLTRQARPS